MPPPEVLAQYVGTYDFRFPENPTIPSIWQAAVAEGTLFMNGAPLVPIAETRFLLGTNPLEFVKDKQGRVTHFSATFVEGELNGRKLSDEEARRAAAPVTQETVDASLVAGNIRQWWVLGALVLAAIVVFLGLRRSSSKVN